jgi:hypothetical protein
MRSWIRPTIARRCVPLLLLFLMITPVVFADSGPDHKLRQVRPIALGTSGGNINDGSRFMCQSGTLGALVKDAAGTQYILSNNHVLARVNSAAIGEDINQPGLIDNLCQKTSGDVVADLSRYVSIQFRKGGGNPPLNTVDAAIAQVRPGAVDASGKIIDIDPLAADPAQDQVGLLVQKSGRTTGLTKGSIAAVDVTIDVSYGNGKIARYVDQFLVNGTGGAFSAGGDSGSLITDMASPPHAVGLLFAGTSTQTIGNPIGSVLTAFGVTMVGSGTSAPGPTLGATTSLTQEAAARAAKRRNQDQLLSVPGAVGVGVGQGGVVEVYLSHASPQSRSQIPEHVDNVPVRVIVTGEFQAY